MLSVGGRHAVGEGDRERVECCLPAHGPAGASGALGVHRSGDHVLNLVSTAALVRGFWKETEPMARMMETVQFNKDVALAGAALAFYWVFANDPGLTLTDSLF